MAENERLAAMQAHADAALAAPRVKREDRTSMTYWLPKLEAAGLPVPKTTMVQISDDECRDVWRVFDGQKMTEASQPFFDRLKAATDAQGYPCFLRTSHTSGKHAWDRACFLRDPNKLRGHVLTIIEYGEINSFIGLPHEWWAVREYLPVKPITVCQGFENMPVCREFRVFTNDGVIQCWHPYWPLNALEQGGAVAPNVAYEDLCALTEKQEVALLVLASKAGDVCKGYWSVDIMDTERGWVITDMAEGEKSFHWETCQHNRESA